MYILHKLIFFTPLLFVLIGNVRTFTCVDSVVSYIYASFFFPWNV